MDNGTIGGNRRRKIFNRMLPATSVVLNALVAYAGFAQEPAAPRIFRCEVNGQTIFSDQPCAATGHSTEVVLSPVNSYHTDPPSAPARKTSNNEAHRDRVPKPTESIAETQMRQKQRCQHLADQLKDIQAELDLHNKPRQSLHLQERQRDIERQRQTEDCR